MSQIIESQKFIALLQKLHSPRTRIPNKEFAIHDAEGELVRAWKAEGRDLTLLPQWDKLTGERLQITKAR